MEKSETEGARDIEKDKEIGAKMKRLGSVANIGSLLGHPIRLLIVSLIANSGGASWSGISKELEGVMGRLNPNTINFHLSKLVAGGIVEKRGGRFLIADGMKENEVFKAMLREVK